MSATVHVEVTVNGERREADVEARLLLVHWLRDELGLTGTHVGCDTTNCGACTVHLDGEAVKSCTVLDRSGRRRRGHDHRGARRGGEASTPSRPRSWTSTASSAASARPGMIMAAADLLARNPNPSDEEIRHGLEGNLCRCTGYHNIVEAVKAAAGSGVTA